MGPILAPWPLNRHRCRCRCQPHVQVPLFFCPWTRDLCVSSPKHESPSPDKDTRCSSSSPPSIHETKAAESSRYINPSPLVPHPQRQTRTQPRSSTHGQCRSRRRRRRSRRSRHCRQRPILHPRRSIQPASAPPLPTSCFFYPLPLLPPLPLMTEKSSGSLPLYHQPIDPAVHDTMGPVSSTSFLSPLRSAELPADTWRHSTADT